MIATINSEWIKLRTVTTHWVLVIVALAFPLVIVTLTTILGDFGSGPDSSEIAGLVGGLAVVTAMLLGSMAAISLTSEYAHSTIRPTYAATPSRVTVQASKLITNTSTVAVLSAIAVFGSWIVARVVLSARDRTVSIGDDGVFTRLISVVVLAVLVSWFAYGLGLLIRNSPVTIAVFLIWPLIIENLVGLVFTLIGWESAVKWLPYQAAIQASVDDQQSSDVLGRPGGLIWFGVVSAAIISVGLFLDRRRDA